MLCLGHLCRINSLNSLWFSKNRGANIRRVYFVLSRHEGYFSYLCLYFGRGILRTPYSIFPAVFSTRLGFCAAGTVLPSTDGRHVVKVFTDEKKASNEAAVLKLCLHTWTFVSTRSGGFIHVRTNLESSCCMQARL
jgi:hypothetical protein